MNKKTTGFTLIELLIVIAIIGILSAIVIGSLGSSRQKGKVAAIKGATQQLMTQGQLYLSEYGNYAQATTSPRAGCYASSTFLTDEIFFFNKIPALMVSNIDDNGAPIACVVHQTGRSFSIVANLGGNKSLCADSDSTRIEAINVDGTTGICTIPPTNALRVPVFINNGTNFTPSITNISIGTTVDFSYAANNNQTRTIACNNGGPTFTVSQSNTAYAYQFNTIGTYQCYRQGNATVRGTINVGL